MRPRRALLYTPGDDSHKIQKAAKLGADCVCMDMEDGVALNKKSEARQTIADALGSLDFGGSERLARINSIGSGFEGEDLAAVLPSRPDGIVVPKVETAKQVRWVSQQITNAENENGWQPLSISLIILIETAKAIINLAQIAGADERLEAMILGADDLADSLGARRTSQNMEVFYARGAIILLIFTIARVW